LAYRREGNEKGELVVWFILYNVFDMFKRFCQKLENLIKNFDLEKQQKYLRRIVSLLKIELYGKDQKIFKKKDILRVNLWYNIWSEINKERLGVVVSPNYYNYHTNNVVILPISTYKVWRKISKQQHYVLWADDYQYLRNDSVVLIGQIRTISKKRIIKKVDVLRSTDAREIWKLITMFFT